MQIHLVCCVNLFCYKQIKIYSNIFLCIHLTGLNKNKNPKNRKTCKSTFPDKRYINKLKNQNKNKKTKNDIKRKPQSKKFPTLKMWLFNGIN